MTSDEISGPRHDWGQIMPPQQQPATNDDEDIRCAHGRPYALDCHEEPCETERQQAAEARALTNQEIALNNALDALRAREAAKAQFQAEKLERLHSDEGQRELAERFAAFVLDGDSICDLDPKEPLIENFLDMDSFARIYGGPKTFKSFVTLDMAACIATGTDWHGNAVTQAPVLYIVAEGARGFGKRVRAWEDRYGKKVTGMKFYPKAVQLGDEEAVREIIAYAKYGEFKFIVFDTQARCTVGINESDNSEMGQIVSALDVLREKTEACVMLVHHSGVGATDRARGASAMLGAVDSDFMCERKPDSLRVTVKTMAQKDREHADMVELDLSKQSGSLVLTEGLTYVSADPDAQILPSITEPRLKALRSLSEFDAVGPQDLGTDMGVSRSLAGKHLKWLADAQLADRVGAKYAINRLGRRLISERDRMARAETHTYDQPDYDQDEL